MELHSRRVVLIGILLPLMGSCGGGDPPVPPAPPELAKYFVQAFAGDDTGPGTRLQPFRTLTRALASVVAGEIIQVLPGLYDAEFNGESFPLAIPPGATVQGDAASLGQAGPTVILGFGPSPGFPSTGNAAVLPGAGSALVGMTVIGSVADVAPFDPTAAVVIVEDDVTIRACTLRNSQGDGISVLSAVSGVTITANQIVDNGRFGAFFVGASTGVVERSSFLRNQIGVYFIATQGPDFGGGALAGQGLNVFSGNLDQDFRLDAALEVFAQSCAWDNVPPVEALGMMAPAAGTDVWLTNGGSVRHEGATLHVP
jgi:hypothetical protein